MLTSGLRSVARRGDRGSPSGQHRGEYPSRRGGHPVQSIAIFDVIFEDDIDGGPSQAKMYATFYTALRSLNAKLDGAGIRIRSVGDRKGWRIAFDLS